MSAQQNQPLSAHRIQEVQDSFSRQHVMGLVQASLPVIEHGMVEIHLPHWQGVEQQHGFVHGGVVGMIADSAGGYAAQTVAASGATVLSVEYKMNFLAPAKGDKLIARGTVLKAGKTLIITQAQVFACTETEQRLCAVMQQTIMPMYDKAEK